ncbi:Phosphoinositide phospholipase C 7 [Hibiscus syriacus]|uniref:Phosphoinositide phospholipase C n=1 Tax=Hibiscus syriacus TaxID=106335 RepID=A0A6A3C5G4_HIBSY|nr:Phosphoinositide phospholipase C 7 [Hibiscus syriacus]
MSQRLCHLNKKDLHLEASFGYLFGDDNSPQASLGVHHDMSAPLSKYFIFTCHNSHLTGNQLSSDCSGVPIINALKRGVRVIELDIWPNSEKDDVDVLHGVTLTAPVAFIKCLESIKESAFISSEFPVFITLEDHLTKDLQNKAANVSLGAFQYFLFTPGGEVLKEFPSPESLKKRVIISTKPPKEYSQIEEVKDKESDLLSDEARDKLAPQKGNDKHLWLMQGMFRANGHCRYVKKPDFLLNPNEIFDPEDKHPVKTTLKVTLYIGEGWCHDFDHTHFDPYSPPDFYAKVGVAGVPEDKNMKKTETVENSWVPFWNQEFEFHITVPELALLRIEVYENDMEKDDFAGETCIPIAELKSGIRAVPLMDNKGDMYNNVKLLMQFEFISPPEAT